MEHQQWKVQYVRKTKPTDPPRAASMSHKTKNLLNNHKEDPVKRNVCCSDIRAADLMKARQSAGLTQAQLAQRLRVTKQVVQQWEKGSKQPQGGAKAILKRTFPSLS